MLHECRRSRRPVPPRRACSVGRTGALRCSRAIWVRIPPPPPSAFESIGPRSASFLGAEQLAEPGAAAAAEQALGLRRATRGVLVDDDERGAVLTVLPLVADRDEILDDRRAEHRRRERSPIGLEPEEDDIAAVERLAEIDLRRRRLPGRADDRRLTRQGSRADRGRRRDPAPAAASASRGTSSSGRASVGAHLAGQGRQASVVHVLDHGREADRHAGKPQRPDRRDRYSAERAAGSAAR